MAKTEVTGAAVAAFTKFICARERHRVAKVAGRAVSKPDPIIAQYRFCNVRRNDDRVTKWIHGRFFNYRGWRGDPNLWFALVVARLFNNEETLCYVDDCILPFKPAAMKKLLHERVKLGWKNFNAAYIVSTAGAKMNKIDYVVDNILVPAWACRKDISAGVVAYNDLEEVNGLLMSLNGFASFMAGQVVADLKYADPAKWEDFHTFATSGPGSKRGLNRVLGRPIDQPLAEAEFRATLATLREKVNGRLSWEPITAQDIQNCLCEYDKYERARLGEGRPKQLYKPQEK